MISISIDNIQKRFGDTEVLKGVSTQFAQGELHGIIGPDGAGKTTLLRVIAGLLHPSKGNIGYQKDGVTLTFSYVKPHLAYMPQQQSLYEDLSIAEHLDFFRDLFQIPKDDYKRKRDDLLRLTRLEEFQSRPAGKLSGGMYKKLGLMCALLRSPMVLLLDEPTNGVDPISRREFWDMLNRLKGDRMTILMATSYMDEAERCDMVHVMDGGRLLSNGEPRALLKKEGVDKFEQLFMRIVK